MNACSFNQKNGTRASYFSLTAASQFAVSLVIPTAHALPFAKGAISDVNAQRNKMQYFQALHSTLRQSRASMRKKTADLGSRHKRTVIMRHINITDMRVYTTRIPVQATHSHGSGDVSTINSVILELTGDSGHTVGAKPHPGLSLPVQPRRMLPHWTNTCVL